MTSSSCKKYAVLRTLKTSGKHSGKVSFSFFNHSCGVMFLVRSDLDFKLKSIEVDNEGRYVIIEADVQSSNIYAPNKVQEQGRFFDNLKKAIQNFVVDKENKIIIGEDFNVTLDSNLDCAGGNPLTKIQ